MPELPILFSAPMVRAILDGRKTVTRRVVRPAPYVQQVAGMYGGGMLCFPDRRKKGRGLVWPNAKADILAQAPYRVGDRLYVRETAMREPHPAEYGLTEAEIPHTWAGACEAAGTIHYRASMSDDQARLVADGRRWIPSIHMPKGWARIWLEVSGVDVQRLREITECQARAEGITWSDGAPDRNGLPTSLVVPAMEGFEALWDILASPGLRWADNPWVWVFEFRRLEVPDADQA